MVIIFPNKLHSQESIKLGYFPNVTHAQALIARHTGQFDKSLGFKVEWSSFNAGPTAVEALFSDLIDASYIGPNPTINGFIKSHGEKFVIVSGAAIGGAGLIIRSDSAIVNEKDFDNKTIATPQLGNTQDVAARLWFTQHGYKFKEKGGTLNLLPIPNADQLLLFNKKELDGAWAIEPWLSRLEIEGNGKLFLDEKNLWPNGKYVTTHLVFSRAFIAKRPELARRLIAAHLDVTQFIQKDLNGAAEMISKQIQNESGSALRMDVLKSALKRVEFSWDPVASSLFTSAKAAYSIGFLKTEPNIQGIYSLDILNSVLKERGLPPVAIE